MTEQELQAACDRFVQHNVLCCLSGLVSTLANSSNPGEGFGVQSLIDQAMELASPVDDYEEAATQAGWEAYTDKFGVACWRDTSDDATFAGTAEQLCEEHNLDPYQWEVYEHWVITDYLGAKLAAKGERVDTDFAGLTVWARTTTGQAISMDAVIRAIVAEVYAPNAP